VPKSASQVEPSSTAPRPCSPRNGPLRLTLSSSSKPSSGGRLGGSRCIAFPTDSYATQVRHQVQPSSVNAPVHPASRQPVYNPGASPTPGPLSPPIAAVAAGAANRLGRDAAATAAVEPARRPFNPQSYYLQSPFRNRPGPASKRLRRISGAARLWNPSNSARALAPPADDSARRRRRRPSTPPPPSVPLSHPTLDDDSNRQADSGASSYPLLTLTEQRQTRHSGSGRPSLQVDRSGSGDHRISLPQSIRHSYDSKKVDYTNTPAGDRQPSPLRATFSDPEEASEASTPRPPLDKGKQKEIMSPEADDRRRSYSRDLERGPDTMDPRRHSNLSAMDGIGSAMSSSNSSIMGEDIQGDMGEEWGPQHPCFPHLNPHVPIGSSEYQSTRIIRIRRDWLLQGDLAPTFSNLYPEILDPAGFSEQEFRRVIEKLNGELVPIFSPYDWRNILDATLGLVTGWLWDDFGFTGVKSRLNRLEAWIEQWNQEIEKTMGSEEGATPPKLISLRRTGYMTLDIQISDPEVAPVPSTPGASQAGGPVEQMEDGPA
ncbi:Golgin subfamily A member 7/ERF4 family-domain-containing protein, partial [Plectosphaerella cucumerina]